MTAPRATARRLPLLACAIGAVLALAACTGAGDTAPSASATASAAPSATVSATASTTPSASAAPAPSGSSSTSGSEQYLGFVQQFSPTLAALQPDVLLALGQEVCTGFRDGRDSGAIAVALGNDERAPDLQVSDAAVILGAAVATLCPQYRDRLAE